MQNSKRCVSGRVNRVPESQPTSRVQPITLLWRQRPRGNYNDIPPTVLIIIATVTRFPISAYSNRVPPLTRHRAIHSSVLHNVHRTPKVAAGANAAAVLAETRSAAMTFMVILVYGCITVVSREQSKQGLAGCYRLA
jgi:hypothetical protein